MTLGFLSTVAVIAVAIFAGLGKFSFWWVLIPAFFAGSLSLSNSRHYSGVIEANKRGNLTTFPMLLAIYCAGELVLAGVTYWLTGLFAG